MLTIALVIGLFTAINLIVVIKKFSNGSWEHALLEIGTLIILALLFGNTILGMLIAMTASLCFSIYLAWFA